MTPFSNLCEYKSAVLVYIVLVHTGANTNQLYLSTLVAVRDWRSLITLTLFLDGTSENVPNKDQNLNAVATLISCHGHFTRPLLLSRVTIRWPTPQNL